MSRVFVDFTCIMHSNLSLQTPVKNGVMFAVLLAERGTFVMQLGNVVWMQYLHGNGSHVVEIANLIHMTKKLVDDRYCTLLSFGLVSERKEP